MVKKSWVARDGGDSRTQVNSLEKHDEDYSSAVDILAAWIAEDVLAFARSFRAEPAAALREALERVRSRSLLDQRDSDEPTIR